MGFFCSLTIYITYTYITLLISMVISLHFIENNQKRKQVNIEIFVF